MIKTTLVVSIVMMLMLIAWGKAAQGIANNRFVPCELIFQCQ